MWVTGSYYWLVREEEEEEEEIGEEGLDEEAGPSTAGPSTQKLKGMRQIKQETQVILTSSELWDLRKDYSHQPDEWIYSMLGWWSQQLAVRRTWSPTAGIPW